MSTEEVRWYALKVFYNRTLEMKRALEAEGVTVYVAMRPVERIVRGRRQIQERPLISSLLFLRCTAGWLKGYKQAHDSGFLYYQDFATHEPAPVSEVEMRSFIILTSADRGTQVEYLGENVPEFKRGEHVRVIEGVYKGAEGYIRKVRSDRKLVVEVKGIAVVAVSYIPPAFLEKII